MDLEDAKIAQAYLLSEAEDIRDLMRTGGLLGSLPPIVKRSQSVNSTGDLMLEVKSQDSVNFLELPEELLQELTPEIKVYKTYFIRGVEFNFLLPTGRVRAMVEGEEKTVELPVIKNVEFTRLGGNPAEVDTNIKFNIKLYARDISSYFTRIAVEDVGVEREFRQAIDRLTAEAIDPSTPAATAEANIETIEALRREVAGFKDGVSWIDLIKIDPGMALNANTQLVTSEAECRIKVEIGYAMDPMASIPSSYNEKEPGDWEKWRAAILAQREVFNLSLFKHQFEFRGEKGVGLSIDFIASGNAKQLSPLADLFSNPAVNAEIEKRLESVKIKRAEKRTAQRELREEEEETVRSEALKECIESLSEEISEIQREIKETRARVRTALLNQLYLNLKISDTERTRVFYRRYKKQGNEDDAARDTEVAWNHHPAGRINVGGANISEADFAFAMGDEEVSNEGRSLDLGDTDTHFSDSSDSDYKLDAYVFLGDIIESAFEILVPGGAETEIKHTQRVNKSWFVYGTTLTNVGGTYSFESPFTHNSGSATAINAEIPNSLRVERLINEFGGYFLGLVEYPDPLDPSGNSIKTPLRDLPICLDVFRGWWLNNYVSTAKRSLPIRDFLTALMRFVEQNVFRDIPYEQGAGEVPDDTPKFVVNNIAPPQDLWNQVYPQSSTKMRFHNANIGNGGVYATSPFPKNTLTCVEQVDNTLLIPPGTARIIFGETERGILKKLTFEREDIPGHAEARLFSDRSSVAGNIALREKYNTSMETLGTTSVLPGSIVYLDPKPLDLGYADEGESLAKSLGLGGLYRVVTITSTLDFSGAGASWMTKLKTKWESFGDGTQGNAVDQLEGSISDCLEKAEQVIRQRALVALEDEAQFDGNY